MLSYNVIETKEGAISVADFSRRPSEVLNKVHYTGKPRIVTRHGKPWVVIIPVGGKINAESEEIVTEAVPFAEGSFNEEALNDIE